ncbi:hypothetical protein LVJ94_07230 [Pendulispora rubella]|uniref:Uncharacterized protein n=1 Tax=Pendulispora rubella TaxID=2741070 RepID=A0ABZ2L7X5_9BACT
MAGGPIVTSLPRSLAPWAKQLAIFPEPIALALRDLASRLTGLLGTLGAPAAGEGSFDGFDGLTRRGSYERLLLTEWFLQEELPEEFIRRAISGEHAFLKRAYRQPSETLRSCVLFDAGPEQLGAPRIAHLAALVVLAQRAEWRKAEWTWGILQDGARKLHTAVHAASVAEFLRARSTHPAAQHDFKAWRSLVHPASELWFVGGDRLDAEAERCKASLLAVSEVLEPGAPPSLRVRVRARTVTLELPPAPVATRLLRDPFEVAVAPRTSAKVALDPRSNLLFSVDARLLYARGAGRSLLTFHVPKSPHGPSGPPATFVPPGDGVVVAVGQWTAKRRFAAVQSDVAITVHHLSKRGGESLSSGHYEPVRGCTSAPVREGQPLQPLGVLAPDQYFFLQGDDTLVELQDGRLRSWPTRAQGRRSRALKGGLAYVDEVEYPVGVTTPRVMVAKYEDDSGPVVSASNLIDLSGIDGKVGVLFFGAPHDLVAYAEPESSRWTIRKKKTTVSVSVGQGHEVVGVVEVQGRPRLVVLDGARTRISLMDHESNEIVVTTTSPILGAAASDASSDIAYFTRDGQLCVHSCTYGTAVLRLTLEMAP